MKKYTQEEFDNFEVVDEVRQCPSGDYSDIENFGCCSFGECCTFGERCSFGERCRFGRRCKFGEYCSFGRWCSFDGYCTFGEYCAFGGCCSFGKYCGFGDHCSFGEYCGFGECCKFGDCCSFGEHCTVEDGHEFTDFFKVEGLGREKRCTYFFKLTDNSIFVRCGCFSGTLQEFRNKVKETHKDTKFGKEYLTIADFVELHFRKE